MQKESPTAAISIPALGVYVVQSDHGAKIVDLSPKGAAASVGLALGDIIDSVNGSPVKGPTELTSALSTISPGSKVLLGYAIRGMWHSEATVTLANP